MYIDTHTQTDGRLDGQREGRMEYLRFLLSPDFPSLTSERRSRVKMETLTAAQLVVMVTLGVVALRAPVRP